MVVTESLPADYWLTLTLSVAQARPGRPRPSPGLKIPLTTGSDWQLILRPAISEIPRKEGREEGGGERRGSFHSPRKSSNFFQKGPKLLKKKHKNAKKNISRAAECERNDPTSEGTITTGWNYWQLRVEVPSQVSSRPTQSFPNKSETKLDRPDSIRIWFLLGILVSLRSIHDEMTTQYCETERWMKGLN